MVYQDRVVLRSADLGDMPQEETVGVHQEIDRRIASYCLARGEMGGRAMSVDFNKLETLSEMHARRYVEIV